ncbi:MAG: pilus assembly protein TadG-related protein [Sulfitobacter sp.]
MSPINRLNSFANEDDGAVAVIVSLLLVVLLGFTALGVDVVSLYRDRAHLQTVSDLAAVSAVAVTDTASDRAEYVLSRNGEPAESLQLLETGRFLRNPEIAPEDRFTVLPEGTAGINAVRVVLEHDAPLHFGRVISDKTHVALDRTALASHTVSASFALDSHILTLDISNLINSLTSTFGASATIDLGAAEAIADVSVNLGDYLEILDAATGGAGRNPADILNDTVSGEELVSALQGLLPDGLETALNGVRSASSGTQIEVASLIGGIDTDLGLTVTGFLSEIEVSALDIIRTLVVADGVGQTFDLDAEVDVVDVLSVQTSLTAGEPAARSAVYTLGEEGAQLHRAAVRLKSDVALSPDLLGNLGVGVSVAEVNLPLYVEVAGATATLDTLACDRASAQNLAASFTTAATPLDPTNGTSVAALYLGALPEDIGGDAINPADLDFADILKVDISIELLFLPDISLPGITIQARSNVAVGQSQEDTVTFTLDDVERGNTVKSFGSGTMLSSAVSGLLSPENTTVRVKLSDQGLISGLVDPLIATLLAILPDRLLSGLAAPLDAVLDQTLNAAGLSLGVGELTLIGHHCEAIQLVR